MIDIPDLYIKITTWTSHFQWRFKHRTL